MREQRCFKGADARAGWVSADNLAATPDLLITWRSDLVPDGGSSRSDALGCALGKENDIQRTGGKMRGEEASH